MALKTTYPPRVEGRSRSASRRIQYGAALWTEGGTSALAHLGLTLAIADDVDGDGHEEVVAGAGTVANTDADGRAFVLSGADGHALIEVRSTAIHPCAGSVPDPGCTADRFGTARALRGLSDRSLVLLFGMPEVRDASLATRGALFAMRCAP